MASERTLSAASTTSDSAVPLSSPDAPTRSRRWHLPALPTLRQAWFQVHWFIGITAGTVLVVIGLTGALLAFHEEILDVINPGVRQVAPSAGPMLTPQQTVDAVLRAGRSERISSVAVQAEPGGSARVTFVARPGERRGDVVYVHPYSGAVLGELQGHGFFEWIESLHRWLLLPREPGRVVAGVLAICLLGLSLSGLYLRWPRNPLRWRTWLTFDTALKGRSFLWGLHSVIGTWALVMYVALTATGIYWCFDAMRDTVDGWAGQKRPPRVTAPAKPPASASAEPKAAEPAPPDLARTWAVFQQQAGDWAEASLRMPAKTGQPVQVTWLAANAPHERARSRLSIEPLTGKVSAEDRYADRSMGARALSTIYPVHMGTYFGLPGRVAMLLASLCLPLFAITGWMLYLDRRRQRRATEAARTAHGQGVPTAVAGTLATDTLLVAYASQAGQAERIALQSATALQRAGLRVAVQSLEQLTPKALRAHRCVLLVASSFGEGEPPDSARRFTRLLEQQGTGALAGMRYGLLALGDRNYARFCGYGHALDEALRKGSAEPLFPLIEVDSGDPAALARWMQTLATLEGAEHLALDGALADTGPELPYTPWRLASREHLNPGSEGGPLFELALTCDTPATWHPGALVEVQARHSAEAVDAWLKAAGLAGAQTVHLAGQPCTLADALAQSVLPVPPLHFADAQACADTLVALAPRTYSVASLPQDGALQLLVRLDRHAGGLGLASGWLTTHAPLGTLVPLRLVANPRFDSATGDVPCLFIGNGSGLAGLRSHLRARVAGGHRRNWLLFGERHSAHDTLCAAEIEGWQAAGFLARLDRVFSRDGGEHRYVQDRLRAAADELRAWVAQGAILYVCGSAQGMGSGVDAVLAEVLGADAIDALIADGRYRRDVY